MKKAAGPSDFIEWDVRNWSPALDYWLAHTTQNLSKSFALELGSRNGGLSLWLAGQGARVLCSDIGLPKTHVIEKHQAYGFSDRIHYEAIDATRIPYEHKFDVIVFKSVLGGIGGALGKEGQARALSEMHKALKKGGELFFAENLTASPLHQSLRRRFVAWGNRWRYIPVEEMKEFLSPFSHVDYRTLGFAGAFGRSETQRNLFGILDQTIFDRLVPEKWRYVIVGVARK